MNRKRRVPALVVIAIGIGGAIWLMHRPGLPVSRKVSYDLGAGHADDVALTVGYHAGARLVSENYWRFPPGTAPERKTDEIRVPPKNLLLTARITHVGGKVTVIERHLDASRPGDVVVFLGDP